MYWGARCPITGITDPALLRASHIVPWAECGDAQRLDVHNGLLLSALWDAAFDVGLISFANDGTVLASPALSATRANRARHREGAATAQPARRPPRQPGRPPHPARLFRNLAGRRDG
jgi:predicted restriction endonuclease